MDNNKVSVALIKKMDRNGKPYLFGRFKFPMDIKLSADEGFAFWVFYSEDGAEELQVGVLRDRDKGDRDEDQNRPTRGKYSYSQGNE